MMTPAALSTYRILRSLELTARVWRKVAIGGDGRPDFARLSDPEFDDLVRAVRPVCPDYKALSQQGGG